MLEPVVGTNSVLLLDGDAHMEQRKLMLPAFHGEKMARLSGLMAEVAEREVACWPRDEPIDAAPAHAAAHPRDHPARRVRARARRRGSIALRERMREMLEFGDQPISLVPPRPREPGGAGAPAGGPRSPGS